MPDEDIRIHRTYRLRRSTVSTVDRVATRHGVYPSTLVDLALAHTLAQIEAGELVIDQKPVAYAVTGLHPRKRA